MKVTVRALSISRAKSELPKLCNSGQSYLITNRDRPTAVLLPFGDYEALIETLDLLANPRAMQVLAAAKAGKLSYQDLDLEDARLGL